MGVTPSKQQSKDGWNASLSHSVSMPLNKSKLEAIEGGNKVPWKSRLLSVPKMVNRESSFGNIFGISRKLRPVHEEEVGAFEEFSDLTEEVSIKGTNGKSLHRSVSFQPNWEPSPEWKVAISCKKVKEGALVAENLSPLNASIQFDPAAEWLGSPCKDVVVDRSAGLRSLLTPVQTPSRSFASPTRPASNPQKLLTLRKSFNSGTASSSPCMSKFLARSGSFRESPVMNNIQREVERVSTVDSLTELASSPLFDPLILSTFEKALKGLSDDSYQSSDSSTIDNNSSASESESSSDGVDSFQVLKPGIDSPVIAGEKDGIIIGSPTLRATSFLNRTISFSRVFSLKNDDKNWSGKDYLDRFERICPPAGEGKVVLYFTTLRAVRKTFEDCCMLRLILKGLRVYVDERDVWMHSKFRRELTEIMGATLPVPRLFISGKHIGGAEEVAQLHEEGILENMLEGLATDWREVCEVCSDVRFIPCRTCSGSCKTFLENGVIERCPDCNENGLTMCPLCAH